MYDLAAGIFIEYPVALNIFFFTFIELFVLYWFWDTSKRYKKEKWIIRVLAIPSIIRILLNITAWGMCYDDYFEWVNCWQCDAASISVLIIALAWNVWKR
jgi:hypothetical protein